MSSSTQGLPVWPLALALVSGASLIAGLLAGSAPTFAWFGIAAAATGLAGAVLWWRQSLQTNALSQELNTALAQAREGQAAAEQTARQRNEFFSSISHDLREPFAQFLEAMRPLDAPSMDPAVAEKVREARRSARLVLMQLNDIADVAAMQVGRMQLRTAPFELDRLLRDLQSLLGQPAKAKGLNLQVTGDSDMPVWVQGDAARLQQVLFNLAFNAIKFSRKGQVQVTVKTLARNGQHADLCFTVADQGAGMHPQLMQQINELFSDAPDTAKFEQAAMGLMLCHRLVRLMNGRLSVTGAPGQGTTFTLTLQLLSCEPAAGAVSEEAPAQAPADALPLAAATSGKLQVLVAEDHPINQKFLGNLLTRLGHSATFCNNGREAVAMVQSMAFDVVLMDLHMPDMDGFEATRAIRAMAGNKARTPVIALTADTQDTARDEARLAGFNEYLVKPVQLEKLRWALQQSSPDGS